MTPTSSLNGLRLLIVEDEMMVAMMIEDLLTDLGCVVVDVSGTLSRGLELAADARLSLDGAILDVNLGGEKVYPIADVLAARGIPFIFATGYGTAGITEAYSHVPTVAKPYNLTALQQALSGLRGPPEG